jgi:hypothetical protein
VRVRVWLKLKVGEMLGVNVGEPLETMISDQHIR